MFLDSEYDDCTTFTLINTWLPKGQGQSLVLTPHYLFNDSWRVHNLNFSHRHKKSVSIIICTYERPESLNETLESLTKQTFKDFEVILITEKGDLSTLRDIGLRCARGDIVSFIDDDVYCPPVWLESVTQSFREGVVGVSGPTIILDEFKNNRDVFKFRWFKNIHDFIFLIGRGQLPGYLSDCGTPSLASCSDRLKFEGEVNYLEACNMAVRKSEAISVGGFDRTYTKTSEWCEVDLALSLSKHGKLLYCQKASLEHRPSKQGIYTSRLKTKHRWENFIYFQKKWEGKVIKKGLRTWAYRGFVWIYLTLKNTQMI